MSNVYMGYYKGYAFMGFKITKKDTPTLSIHYFAIDTWHGIKGYKKIYTNRYGMMYVKINGIRCYITQ